MADLIFTTASKVVEIYLKAIAAGKHCDRLLKSLHYKVSYL
ncbi:hypothetical protein [Nostoc punctiforme]|nr:hypothetical protein [Nostoc punctiforme]